MRGLLAIIALCLLPGAVLAQTSLPMRGLSADPDAPIEVEADALEVSQADGSALFRGNVLIVQADLRLAAAEVKVDYETPEGGGAARIARLTATGGVTLASGSEQAEAERAVYEVSAGTITMTGSVLLTQGPTVVSGERLVVQLAAGTGVMEGRVRTVISPGAGSGTGGSGAGAGRN